MSLCPRDRAIAAALRGLAIVATLLGAAPAHAQVGTWNVEGRVKILACVGDQCVADSDRLSGTSTLNEDGTYQSPNLGAGCLAGVPDETGQWRLEGHNRIAFEPANMDDLVDAILSCFPDVSFNLRDYSSRGKLKKDGQLIKGKSRLRGLVFVDGQTVAARAVLRWKATPALAGTAASSRAAAAATPLAARALVLVLQRLSSR